MAMHISCTVACEEASTLLTSLRNVPGSYPVKVRGKAAPQTITLPKEHPVKLRIRGMSFGTSAELSPSPERSDQESEVASCSPAHSDEGMWGLFQDADADCTLLSVELPEACSTVDAPPGIAPLVLSLDNVIGPASPPAQTLGCYQEHAEGFTDGFLCATGVQIGNDLTWIGVSPSDATASRPPSEGSAHSQASVDAAAGVLSVQPPQAAPDSLAPGSAELPSIGSAGHTEGRCKPCAFFHEQGCATGRTCLFCHSCKPGEKLRRRREKREVVQLVRQLRRARRQSCSHGSD